MFERVVYCCSNCKKEFNSKKECKLHEKECKKSFAIRRYEIDVIETNNNNIVEIGQIDFSNAIKEKEFINLDNYNIGFFSLITIVSKFKLKAPKE